MKNIKNIKSILLSLVIVLSIGLFIVPSPKASAACATGEAALAEKTTAASSATGSSSGGQEVCCPKGSNDTSKNCFFAKYINPVIKVLSAIAGIAVVGGIIWGGIQYGMSGGDPQKVAKGKSSITKALVGLVSFLLLFAFIQFITPGSVQNAATSTTTASLTQLKGCIDSHTFLGLKPWYAYLPSDSFYDNCSLKEDITIMPTNGSNGFLPQVVLAIVDDLVRIAALVAVAFVIVGGVKYLTSQGEPAQTKQALSSIINALIGLAIAIIAAAVVSYIGKKLSA